MLAELFEKFRNKCIEIYELHPAHFLSAPGLAWQSCLKNTGVKLELLTNIDMLLIAEKLDDNFIKNHDENSNKGYIIEVDAEYRKHVLDLHFDLPMLAEKKKIIKYNKLVCDIMTKKTMLFT